MNWKLRWCSMLVPAVIMIGGGDETDGTPFRCNFPEVTNELTPDYFANWIVFFCIQGNKTKVSKPNKIPESNKKRKRMTIELLF